MPPTPPPLWSPGSAPPPDRAAHLTPARYLTADLPGIGGTIKDRPEDFLVDEQPLYEPVGQGEHIYMLVEKRSMSTLELVGLLAGHFGVRRSAIGYAGLKDKHALTRQVISVHVPGKKIEDFPMVRHERIGVLWTDYHTNKLRPGHLRGNRFSIRVRGVPIGAVLTAQKALQRLERLGVPNRFGEQRFGHLANNHVVGRAIVLGDRKGVVDEILGPGRERPQVQAEARRLYAEGNFAAALDAFPRSARTEGAILRALVNGATHERAAATVGEVEVRYFVSAFQSAVFNAVLDARLLAGTLGELYEGDVAWKHDNGALFAVTPEVAADPELAARLAAFDISPSGPMWGVSMKRATGRTDEAEIAALAGAGVTLDDLQRFDERAGNLINGARRPLRVPLLYPDVEGGADEHGTYVRCVFELPAGSFATTVMQEIMKPEPGPSAAAPDLESEPETP